MLFEVRHTAKQVYSCMSQYSSTLDIITDIQHLLKFRNIKHMPESCTNKILDAKQDSQLLHNLIKTDSFEPVIRI